MFYKTIIFNLATIVMLLLQVCLTLSQVWLMVLQVWLMVLLEVWLALLQFYYNEPQKINHSSINRLMFIKIIPKHVAPWLKPLPPTPEMLFLINFRLDFEQFSENQQLLIISQMINPIGSIDDPDEIRYLHSCVQESTFLQNWQTELLDYPLIHKFNNRSISYLKESLLQLSVASRGDLMVMLIQISQEVAKRGLRIIYWTMQDGLSLEQVEGIYSPDIISVEEKDRVMAILHTSSLLSQHILFQHLQLEQQIVLYLQHVRYNLLQTRIDMKLELLRFFR